MGRVRKSKIDGRLESARQMADQIRDSMRYSREADFTLTVALVLAEKRIDDLLIEMHKED